MTLTAYLVCAFCVFLVYLFMNWYLRRCKHEYTCISYSHYDDLSYGSSAPSTLSTHQYQKCGKIVKSLFYAGGHLSKEHLDKIKDPKPCSL